MSVLRSMRAITRSPGFTLVEAAVVIAVIGIVGSILTVFFQGAVTSYFSSVRRAQLSDVADSALRRIARDIQTALPNSARADASTFFLEFIPVRSGGRYRASTDGGTNALDVSNAADNDFNVLGPGVTIAAGDKIVIYNTGQAGANVYEAGATNIRSFTGAPGAALTTVQFSIAGGQFPRDSDSLRFQVVSTPVTYACDAATGTLWRYAGYAIQPAQPAAIAGGLLVTGSGNVAGAPLATNVVCVAGDAANIGTGFQVRAVDGLVLLRIQLRDSSGETLSLWREVHVDNTP
jgi:MSHA biogenesis protein MshO